jgi:hypothetical protein
MRMPSSPPDLINQGYYVTLALDISPLVSCYFDRGVYSLYVVHLLEFSRVELRNGRVPSDSTSL